MRGVFVSALGSARLESLRQRLNGDEALKCKYGIEPPVVGVLSDENLTKYRVWGRQGYAIAITAH